MWVEDPVMLLCNGANSNYEGYCEVIGTKSPAIFPSQVTPVSLVG